MQTTYKNTSQWNSTELRAGTYDGSARARSFLRFDTSPIDGAHVLSADLRLWNWHSWSCNSRQVEVRRLTSGFDSSTVWGSQPSQGAVEGTASFAHGYSSACPNDWGEVSITGLVQDWADGQANHGLAVRAGNESDVHGWKKFNSMDASSRRPRIEVTYEHDEADPGEPVWYLNNDFDGNPDVPAFNYGDHGDTPLAGDWDKDGRDTPGVRRGKRWYLSDTRGGDIDHEFRYGAADDVALVGDWNGDGRTTIGIRRGKEWHLKNSLSGGSADISFSYGRSGDVPVVGDWNGDGRDTIGVRRGKEWHLRNALSGGSADISFSYGSADEEPVVGDWNGNGTTTVGVRRGKEWLLRNANRAGSADIDFKFGRSGDLALTGDWNDDGCVTIGVVRQDDGDPEPDPEAEVPRLDAPSDGWRFTSEPTLEATNTGDDPAEIEFEVTDVSGQTVETHRTDEVSSGGSAAFEPDLDAGWYEWTARAIAGSDESDDASPQTFEHSPDPAEAPGAGDRGFYQFDDLQLTDRTTLRVNAANGNLMLQTSDFEIRGVAGHDLRLQRTHNSQDVGSDGRSAGARWVLGPGRDTGIYRAGDGSVVYESPDGARMRFEPGDEDGQWETPTGLRATLSGTGPFTLAFHESAEEFEFDEGGSLTAHVDRSGNEIAYDYDGWELVAITDSHGRDVTIDYSGGFVDEVADHTGRTVGYDHDGEGNLTEVTDAAGETMTFAYDDDQRLTEVTDPRGTTTAIDYDADGRVVEVRRDDDGVLDDPVVWQWDHQSGETELTDPRGNATTYHHDGLGRVERVVDAVGRERTVEYDADSNVVALTGNAPGGTEGPETQLTYDDGRLVEVAQPSGATSTFTYQDANNRHAPDSYTNPQGSTVDYAYDEAGRLSAVVPRSDAGGDGYQVAHNDDGTIDSLTAPGGAVTDYVYDSGELTRIERPGPVGDETLDYDGLSRLVSRVDGNGDETTYAYDGLDRVVEVGFDDGGSVESEFDGNGNRVRQTDREDADDTEVRQFEFDELNRLVRETLPTGVNDYGYDPAGNLVSFEDPGGEVTYAYDAVSLPVEVTDPDGATIELSYDDDNLREETVFPGGVVQSEDRDDDGNLTRIAAEDAAGAALTDLAYGYSSGGEPTALRQRLTDHVAGTETTYGYDDHDRLVSATETDTGTGEEVASWGYGYDADSNLTELTVDGDTVTFTVNDAQQITGSSDGESWSFDDAGQLLEADPAEGPATTWSYNRRGQTTEVDDPDAGQVGFAYAGEGQADRTEVDGATLHRSALGVTTIIPEDQPAGSAHYTRLPSGEVLARRHATDGDRYYLVDALGSTVALVDDDGEVTNRYDYDPYGGVDEERLAGAVEQPWRYTGAHHDPHGDHHIGHRYLDGGLGRWTQPDPASDRPNPTQPGEASPYAYTGCDPINHTDPTGLCVEDIFNALFSDVPVNRIQALIWGGLGVAGAGSGIISGAGALGATGTGMAAATAAGLPLIAIGVGLVGYGVSEACL